MMLKKPTAGQAGSHARGDPVRRAPIGERTGRRSANRPPARREGARGRRGIPRFQSWEDVKKGGGLRHGVVEFPPAWTRILGAERVAAYRTTPGGNIEVAIDLSSEIAGARQSVIPTPLRERAEPGRPGRVLTGGRVVPGGRAPIGEEQLRLRGTLPAELARVVVPSKPRPPPLLHLPVPYEPRERTEFGVILIPRAALQAYQEFAAALPNDKRNQRELVWGAAWSIFTSRIEAPTFGAVVRAVSAGGYNFSPGTVRQTAYRPGTIPNDVVLGAPGEVPVTYFGVVALVSTASGYALAPKHLSNFDELMRGLGWTQCARIPRAKTAIWCPTSRPRASPQSAFPGGPPPAILAPPRNTQTR